MCTCYFSSQNERTTTTSPAMEFHRRGPIRSIPVCVPDDDDDDDISLQTGLPVYVTALPY